VGNLSEEIRPASLYSHFIQCGHILTIQKKYSKFAFVEFETVESAEYAIEKLNGSVMCGQRIKVNKILNEEEKKLKDCEAKSSNGEIKCE
jgi:RNA recognition motif-containing protein